MHIYLGVNQSVTWTLIPPSTRRVEISAVEELAGSWNADAIT
ncbi:MAG: hypothetical protein OXF40_10205 [Rhodospirillales bacterium]|nr:hypothetical protein [Rhodospirillales bacterium]